MSFREKLPSIEDRKIQSEITGLILKIYANRKKHEVCLINLDPDGFRLISGVDLRRYRFISLEETYKRLSQQYGDCKNL